MAHWHEDTGYVIHITYTQITDFYRSHSLWEVAIGKLSDLNPKIKRSNT